eukprot:gene21144-biopygen11843
MVREVAVYVTEQWDHFAVQGFEQLRGDHAGRAIAAVHHHFEAAREFDVAGDLVRVALQDVDFGDAAFAAGQVVGLQAGVQGLNLFVGEGIASDDDLEAVVVRRVMAAGEHHARLAGQYVGCVVQRRRRHQAHVADVATAVGQALDQLLDQLGAGQAAITAYGNVGLALCQALGANGAADPVGGLGGQGLGDHATNVIGAENAVGKCRGDSGWVAHCGGELHR